MWRLPLISDAKRTSVCGRLFANFGRLAHFHDHELPVVDRPRSLDTFMGGEDFAYYLERVPGCYFFLGTRNEARGFAHPHHSPRFDIDESALAAGVEIMTRVIKCYLA